MKIGDRVFVKGIVDEIRNDVVIIKNDGGYFGTVPSEIIKYVEREQNRDIKEIKEIMKCDVDAETKCKMISNILTAKPHYFEEKDPCEDCDYSEIMDWEQDAKTGKAKPIYWCERHKEPCDDAVSRQAVLDCLTVTKLKMFDVTLRAREEIKKLPSVTQKLGKWEDLHICWVCSECGQETHIEHKYCPNCGAKMESEV